jgi:CheY-like chemotaxis protein
MYEANMSAGGGEVEFPPLQPRPMRVLVVMHDVDTLSLVRMTVERMGHEVVVARGCDEATWRLQGSEPAHPIDLIIADLNLPDGDAVELMSAFRQRFGRPAIAIRDVGEEGDAGRCVRAGIDLSPMIAKVLETHVENQLRCVGAGSQSPELGEGGSFGEAPLLRSGA